MNINACVNCGSNEGLFAWCKECKKDWCNICDPHHVEETLYENKRIGTCSKCKRKLQGNMTWDEFYLRQAWLVSLKSKDISTKVGAVIVGLGNEVRSLGYNGFPRGVSDDIAERHLRPAKYMFTEHAERNSLYNALRANIPVAGCRLYLNYAPYPCHDCTRGVIQSGIDEIITSDVEFPGLGSWAESLKVGGEMLKEAGVKVRRVAGFGIEQMKGIGD